MVRRYVAFASAGTLATAVAGTDADEAGAGVSEALGAPAAGAAGGCGSAATLDFSSSINRWFDTSDLPRCVDRSAKESEVIMNTIAQTSVALSMNAFV